MGSRLRIIGVAMIVIGIVSWIAAGYAYMRAQDGAAALEGFSAAQNVTLSYDDEGRVTDRGTVEGGEAILELLGETWQWPINDGEMNPEDPVVNTATEYMYQMATIATHTLHGNQSVVLTETTEWDGDRDGAIAEDAPTFTPGVWDPKVEGYGDAVFMPGTYEVPVGERYWTGFNRLHPLDGPARGQTWSDTVHGLFAELGVGATTATALQLAMGVVGVTALMGFGFVVGGIGLLWAGMGGRKEDEPAEPAAA